MRIRVMIDVREPLNDCVTLKLCGDQVCKIPVKYERLPMICFYCGRLDHGTNECIDVLGDSTPKRILIHLCMLCLGSFLGRRKVRKIRGRMVVILHL